MATAGWYAYDIRLYAIKNYGLVIHEFDPWFNFRATQYLLDNGLYKFFHWFDYMSWYPLGRPVGTTIYPGMQMTSVGIYHTLEAMGKEWAMSINDICVYVPAWFGVSATTFLGLLAGECSGSWSAGAFAAFIMSIVPAHIMRSVGGGYDNESIAMTAMCMTFYCWCRSLRDCPNTKNGQATRDSYVWGAITGVAYIYMVAAWGGFVFVLNLIGLHAAVLVALGRYSSKVREGGEQEGEGGGGEGGGGGRGGAGVSQRGAS
jgi:dolichyl-diphosphooligosaccharide--protein glycosyltransferase